MKFRVNIRQRGKSYVLDYINPEGCRRRFSVGSDEQQARRLANRFTDWLLDGKDPEREMERARQREKAKSKTLREFFPEFMKRHGLRQSENTQNLYQRFFKNFCRCPQLIDSSLEEINKSLAIDYSELRMKQDEAKPATANREISLLRNILSRAVEWDIIERNPLTNYRMLKEADKRDVFVTPEQIGELISCYEPIMADIVAFAVYTGLRKENILGLRIEQISFYDLKGGGELELTVKGNKKRRKALGEKAAEIIKRNAGTSTTGYVFINPQTGTRFTSINRTFDRHVKRLGLKVNSTKLRFHDLRHVTASWLSQRGVSLDTLRYVLDHEDRDTTDRYTTPDLLSLGNVMDLLPEIRKGA